MTSDESHIDGVKLYRPRARAPKGKQTKCLPKSTRAHRFTLLAAMSLDGLMAAKSVSGPVTRPTIEDYFQYDLVSTFTSLRPCYNPGLIGWVL